jgi:hypothetical protein
MRSESSVADPTRARYVRPTELMKNRQSILVGATSVLLLVQLAITVMAVPCANGGCAGMGGVSDTALLPACCCGPGECAAELAQMPNTETALPGEGQLISLLSLSAPLAPALATPVVVAPVIHMPVPVTSPSPTLFLLHASFLI